MVGYYCLYSPEMECYVGAGQLTDGFKWLPDASPEKLTYADGNILLGERAFVFTMIRLATIYNHHARGTTGIPPNVSRNDSAEMVVRVLQSGIDLYVIPCEVEDSVCKPDHRYAFPYSPAPDDLYSEDLFDYG